MHKREKILLLLVGLGLLSLFLTTFVLAAPSAPVNVVNHKTRECAMISGGDECNTCVPTGDWEILIGDCPIGYTKLDDFVPSSCTYSGNQISMCDYAKDSAKSPNTKYFLIVLVVIAVLSGILYYVKKRVVRD
jgi:hypothetical protein